MSKISTFSEESIADYKSDQPTEEVQQGNWFENLSIKHKLRLTFGGNFLFAMVIGLVVFIGLTNLSTTNVEISGRGNIALGAGEMTTELAKLRADLGDGASPARIDGRLDELDRKTQLVGTLAAVALPTVSADIAAIDADLSLLRTQIASGALADENTRDNAIDAVVAKVATLRQTARLSAREAVESSGTTVNTLLFIFMIMVPISFVLSALVMRFFDRNIGGALAQIVERMLQLSNGDKDSEVPMQDRADELGDIARSLKYFCYVGRRAEQFSTEAAEAAKVKLELEEERSRELKKEQERHAAELAKLAADFERTVGQIVTGVASASSQLKDTAGAMSKTAEASSQQASEVAKAMEETSSGVTAAAAASDEFAMSIGEISRQAASSAELARMASDSTEHADLTISALSDSASQVGQIVEMIQSIAQRTNLLALNASIEAARGGEAGRGFAVVASEVKELAAQTSRATEEISAQIAAMQDSTQASVGALRTIGDHVQQLESTAISIASAVDQQSVAGQDLARSIDMAARSTDDVSGHISQVRENSLSTGSAASQVLSSATEMESQSTALRQQVDNFLVRFRAAD